MACGSKPYHILNFANTLMFYYFLIQSYAIPLFCCCGVCSLSICSVFHRVFHDLVRSLVPVSQRSNGIVVGRASICPPEGLWAHGWGGGSAAERVSLLVPASGGLFRSTTVIPRAQPGDWW